jgi:PAS domain S-box-containing protein
LRVSSIDSSGPPKDAGSSGEELRIRSIMTGLLDPVITIDRYGVILFVSDSVRAVFGYSPDELIGRNIKLLMPEPHRSKHDEYLNNYRQTGETWILNTIREFEAVRKGGARFWVELSVARVDVPGQDQPLFTGSFRDISARKQVERALRQSEARFRAIFDQEIQLVGLLGPTGIVLEMNRTALKSAGVGRGDVIGRPFWETSWWSHDPELVKRCRRWVELAAGGETVREEVIFPDPIGGEKYVDFSLKPIMGEGGKVILLLPEGRDITDLKRAQARENQVLQALAAIGEQTSVLAHEIKNPITSIHLALRAVAKNLDEDEAAVLEELVDRMRRLEGKIRRTLSFARPLDLELKDMPVLPLLLDSVDILRDEAESRDITLLLEAAPETPPVRVDAGRIDDLVTNLVRNGMDAVADGGRVEVRARSEGRHVLITVEDDGPGLPAGPVDELFKPFVTHKTAGTGIGLAVARKIAEAHAGTLDAGASSELGGARFELRLPLAGFRDLSGEQVGE